MPQSKRHPARRPQQRNARPSHKPGSPARKAAPAAPPSTGARAVLERASIKPLVIMHSLPTWLVPVLLAVLLLAGLALPWRWAGLILLVPALFLGWLLALSWPLVSASGRLLRVLVVVAILGAAVMRLGGRL